MFYVIAEFNTDDNNKWVVDQRIRSGDPLPMSVFGPFTEREDANAYTEDFMPDDTDVYDVWVTEQDPEPGWTINSPEEYSYHGYKLLVAGDDSPMSLVARGESKDCNEKKSVA